MIRTAFHALTAIVLLTAVPASVLAAGRAVPVSVAAPTVKSVLADHSYCTVCHGSSANGDVAIAAPALAGIEPWYLAEQIKSYHAGHRGQDYAVDPAGAEMRIVARQLDEGQIGSITQYIRQFRYEPRETFVQGDAVNGKGLYTASCAACHGTQAQGNEALHAPDLARLNDWYIVDAFKKYQSGLRGSTAASPWDNQMHAISTALPKEFAINDVAAYLATIHTELKP